MTIEYNVAMEVEAIQPDKNYSLKEVRDLRLIPWAVHYQTIRRIVNADFFGENILHAVREGEGRQTRYTIKGSSIIKYLKKYAPAMIGTVRKPKQTYANKSKEGHRA